MMKLETLQAVVATVDSQRHSDLADAILQRWTHDAERARYWRASANFVFFFKRDGQDYVLRFNHARERTVAVIQAEIDYVMMLAARGMRVAKPVQSRAGQYVESIDTSQGEFHAVVFAALPGDQLEVEDLTPEQFTLWGQALGELHNASMYYANSGRPTWADHLAFIAATLPRHETAARQVLDQLTTQLGKLPVDQQRFGLIHFDFELDNLVWDAGQPGIIDFDDCAGYWYVADIAFALRDLFEDSAAKVDLQNEAFRQFIQGYGRVRPIDDEVLQQLPLFLRLHHLILFARLQRALTPVDPAGELPWMPELRDKLSVKMQFYRAQFSG